MVCKLAQQTVSCHQSSAHALLQMQCHSSYQFLAALKTMKPMLTSLQVQALCHLAIAALAKHT